MVESQGDQYDIIGLEALTVDDAAQLLLDGAGSLPLRLRILMTVPKLGKW